MNGTLVLGFLVLSIGGGCGSSAESRVVSSAQSPKPLLERFPLRLHQRWTEHTEEEGTVKVEQVEETWTPLGNDIWEALAHVVGAPAKPALRIRYALTDAGLVNTGVGEGDVMGTYDHPRVVLPIDAHAGQAWESTHSLSGLPAARRACHIDAAPECSGGLRVECALHRPDGSIFTDAQLYCEGVGWAGHRSSHTGIDGVTVASRSWSDDMH